MRNLRARTLWIISFSSILVTVGLIFACVYTQGWLNKVMLVLMVLSCLTFTFTVQSAVTKSMKIKPKKEKYITKNYENSNNLHNKLNENKFVKRERGYGESFLLIKNNKAFKVVLVSDPVGYFTNTSLDDNDPSDNSKKLDKCNVFIGVEIFLNTNEDLMNKITDFSLEGGRVYYTALTKNEDSTYTCHNYLEPLENQIEAFNELYEMLGFKEIVDDGNIITNEEEVKPE